MLTQLKNGVSVMFAHSKFTSCRPPLIEINNERSLEYKISACIFFNISYFKLNAFAFVFLMYMSLIYIYIYIYIYIFMLNRCL